MDRRVSLLLVEDEDVLRMLVTQFLQGEGFRVTEARDGGEGFLKYRDEGPFDLLLVDLNLPVFSGVEVCRRVKAADRLQKIMICSAAIVREHEDELIGLGVEHFLTKPYHPANLLAHIHLELGRPSGSVPSTPVAPGTRPA